MEIPVVPKLKKEIKDFGESLSLEAGGDISESLNEFLRRFAVAAMVAFDHQDDPFLLASSPEFNQAFFKAYGIEERNK